MTLINLESRKTGLYGSNVTAIQLQTLKTKVRMIVQNIDRNRSKQLCKCNYSPSGWCSLGGQRRQSPPSPQLSPRDEVPGVPRTPWPKNQECHTGWGWGGRVISESMFTWHSSMHTKGLLPAGDRPQLRSVSLTLKKLSFTHLGTVQFMGGWHRHFTSLDAKNSTDMIKIVGLCSSSLSKSPGPWPTWWNDRFLEIFYNQGKTRRWNMHLKHLAGD